MTLEVPTTPGQESCDARKARAYLKRGAATMRRRCRPTSATADPYTLCRASLNSTSGLMLPRGPLRSTAKPVIRPPSVNVTSLTQGTTRR